MKAKIQRYGFTVAIIHVKRINGGTLEIAHLYTHPNFRRNGFANKLLEKAIAYAKDNFKDLIAVLDPEPGFSVSDMRSWYKRHGFKSAWVDLGGYHKPGMILYSPEPSKPYP